MSDDFKLKKLRALVEEMRKHAARIGPLHSWWDEIVHAEMSITQQPLIGYRGEIAPVPEAMARVERLLGPAPTRDCYRVAGLLVSVATWAVAPENAGDPPPLCYMTLANGRRVYQVYVSERDAEAFCDERNAAGDGVQYRVVEVTIEEAL